MSNVYISIMLDRRKHALLQNVALPFLTSEVKRQRQKASGDGRTTISRVGQPMMMMMVVVRFSEF